MTLVVMKLWIAKGDYYNMSKRRGPTLDDKGNVTDGGKEVDSLTQ